MSKVDKKTINKVFIKLGIIVSVFLIIIGCVSWYGYKFITDNVQTELTSQKIYFPAEGSPSFSPNEFPDLQQYAGQIVDNGEKAKAYADGFIGRHLKLIGNGKTYSEVSAASLADPTNTALQQQTQTMFRGTTLRATLLTSGYAFWTMGVVVGYIAIASLVGAGIMLIFACLCAIRSSKIK